MARLRDVLERFRPAGTPGAAARPGVPADRVAELSAELEPVLALLAQVEDEAEAIRRAGRRRAQHCRTEAGRHAEAILGDATARAGAVRAQAAAQAQADAARSWTRMAEQAQRAGDAVRERGGRRMPDLVGLAVTRAQAVLAAPVETDRASGVAR